MSVMQRIALLSNMNINALRFRFREKNTTFFASGYDTWQQEFLNRDSDFYQFNPQFCFLIIDGKQLFESFGAERIEAIFDCIETAAGNLPLCRFFVSDIDVFNQRLGDLKSEDEYFLFECVWKKRLNINVRNYRNVYIFPLKDIILRNGRNNIYSQKMWYVASNRFSVAGEHIIVDRVYELIRPAITLSKKCLVLDLDNTLWGGVIGEDGIEGIQLDDRGPGARFYDFQKVLKEIHSRGIILAVASKNSMEDAERGFSHPKMLLQKNDFTVMEINWNAKSDNIIQIAQELNIGLDSLVFVDDNPIEREEMRQRQPDVVVADFPDDTTQLPKFAVDLYNRLFYSWDMVIEDVNKTKMYQENLKRSVSMKSFASLNDFLIDMEMKLSIIEVDAATLLRTYQMIQKTNQFNVTTKRYSEEELSRMIKDNKTMMLLGHVQDKYGDNGNSILVIVRRISQHEAEIDSFLMSCRIMNRSIEFGFLYAVEKMLVSMGADTIFASYIPTTKNSPASMFFEDAGYEVITNDGNKKYYKIMPKIVNERKRKKCYVTVI
jgi:FkbH-like protein